MTSGVKENEAAIKPVRWIACTKCLKWRKVPNQTVWEGDFDCVVVQQHCGEPQDTSYTAPKATGPTAIKEQQQPSTALSSTPSATQATVQHSVGDKVEVRRGQQWEPGCIIDIFSRVAAADPDKIGGREKVLKIRLDGAPIRRRVSRLSKLSRKVLLKSSWSSDVRKPKPGANGVPGRQDLSTSTVSCAEQHSSFPTSKKQSRPTPQHEKSGHDVVGDSISDSFNETHSNPFSVNEDEQTNQHGLVELSGLSRIKEIDWSQDTNFSLEQNHCRRPVGLCNFGNRCYANAVLQCLAAGVAGCPRFCSAMEELLRHVVAHQANQGSATASAANLRPTSPVTLSVVSFILRISNSTVLQDPKLKSEGANVGVNEADSGDEVFDPTAAVDAVSTLHPCFRDGKQHDAHEFFVHTIEAMTMEFQRACTTKNVVSPWKRLLCGTLVRKISCQTQLPDQTGSVCSQETNELHTFSTLTLPMIDPKRLVPPRDTILLMDCLRHAFKDEVLDGSNLWQCSECKRDVRAKIVTTGQKLPRLLVLHLNRFQPPRHQDVQVESAVSRESVPNTKNNPHASKENEVDHPVNGPEHSDTDAVEKQEQRRRTMVLPVEKDERSVVFPLDGLDVSQAMGYSLNDGEQKVIYDCFGVVYHLGGMMCGTFCSIPRCRNGPAFSDLGFVIHYRTLHSCRSLLAIRQR